MPPIRPIGHIAGNLRILAISARYRLRLATDSHRYLCWVDDDGCVYLALTRHPRANAVQRHYPEHIVQTYAKPRGAPFPLTVDDIANDLQDARHAQATRHLREAQPEAHAA